MAAGFLCLGLEGDVRGGFRVSAAHIKCQERAALPFKTAHQRHIKAADATESTPPGAASSRPSRPG